MTGIDVLAHIVGAVGLLLWGVRMVRTGMTRAFGAALRQALARQTRTRGRAFLAGLGVTSLLQSSTATALLVSSFTRSRLISLPIGLSMMLGADVGSAVVAQLFSFNIKGLWTIFVPIGAFAFIASKSNLSRNIARISFGFGLMLLALSQIGMAAAGLQDSSIFRSLLGGLAGEPFLGFVIAVVVTWFFHSSLSVILLVMSLVTTSILSLPLAFAIVLGANIGGALTPLSALAGSPADTRRVPVANVAMRATIALLLLVPLLFMKSKFPIGHEHAGQIVIGFHIVFNLIVAIIFIPFVGKISELVLWAVPEPPTGPDLSRPRHLDPNVVDNPPEALACAMRETLNVGEHVMNMLRLVLVVFEKSDSKLIKEVEKSDNVVDALHHAVKMYLIRASAGEMSEEESRRYFEILTFTTNLEHIGDIIDKNLMELANKKIKGKYTFSAEGSFEIQEFHARVLANMQLALNVFATRDLALARRLLLEKPVMREAELSAAENHYKRLREGRLESIETSAIHLDLLRDLKRINDHIISTCYPMLEAAGALRRTRLLESDAEHIPLGHSSTQATNVSC